MRPQKGWIALPECDPLLVHAAANGLIVSCVTRARQLGLWSVAGAKERPHFRARSAGSVKRREGIKVHWHRPLLRVPQASLLDSLEDTLHLVAHCLPFEHALAVWESALRQRKVDLHALQALPMRGPARRIRSAAVPFSDSGLETLVRTRLQWLNVPIYAQSWLYGHRVDFLIGDRLVLQIDGATHTGSQRTKDIAHDAQLHLRGYVVFRVGYQQVMFEWNQVQDRIMRAVAQGLHRAG